MSTTNYSGQQRASAASRLRTSNLSIAVGRELLLIAFKLRPIDVAFVVILQQDLALRKWLAAATALAGPPINNLGALLTFAVSVGASVKRIFEYTNI